MLQLVVATGKAPGGDWVTRTLHKLGPLPQPGVFLQGLVVLGPGGDVIFTRALERSIIETLVNFGKEHSELPHSASTFDTIEAALLLLGWRYNLAEGLIDYLVACCCSRPCDRSVSHCCLLELQTQPSRHMQLTES